jgi:hypothetical protein
MQALKARVMAPPPNQKPKRKQKKKKPRSSSDSDSDDSSSSSSSSEEEEPPPPNRGRAYRHKYKALKAQLKEGAVQVAARAELQSRLDRQVKAAAYHSIFPMAGQNPFS